MSILAIRVVCSECYEELEWHVREGVSEDMVYVEPCKACLEDTQPSMQQTVRKHSSDCSGLHDANSACDCDFAELLKKFFKEADFLGHSTSYEARTVLEFAQWLDNRSAQQSGQSDVCSACHGNGLDFTLGQAGACNVCGGSGKCP